MASRGTNDLSKLPALFESMGSTFYSPSSEEEGAPQEKSYKSVAKSSLATLMAYMIGVDDTNMEEYFYEYNGDLIEQLRENRAPTVIRCLNRFRTEIMSHFLEIDQQLYYQMGGLESCSFFDLDEIRLLRSLGVEPVKQGLRAEDYSIHFDKLIRENIDACKELFPEWINFAYIKELFVVPKFSRKEVRKEEYDKFKTNRNLYPFQKYIHWEPVDCGNMLYSDGKFVNVLYELHNDVFKDQSKFRDADKDTKLSIYDFIEKSERVMIVVDCENSDVFKLHAALKSLDDEEVA